MGRSSLHDNAGTLTPVGCVEPDSLRQGPRLLLWSLDDPVLSWTAGTFSHPT